MSVIDDIMDDSKCKGPGLFRRTLSWLNSLYWGFRHRTINRYNIIPIRSLAPGYYDADTRLFHGAFDLMVEFCEVELAWMEMYKVKVPWWQTRESYRKVHAEELVINYFKWSEEYKDEDTNQGHPKAEYHKELKDLYVWYKHTRPLRPSSTEYWWDNRNSDPDALKKSVAMDDAYDAEDTAQMIRLVKIRGCMWT